MMIHAGKYLLLLFFICLLPYCAGAGAPRTLKVQAGSTLNKVDRLQFQLVNARLTKQVNLKYKRALERFSRAYRKNAAPQTLQPHLKEIQTQLRMKPNERLLFRWGPDLHAKSSFLPQEYRVVGPALMNCRDIKQVYGKPGKYGSYYDIYLDLNPAGAKTFSKVTAKNLGQRIAISVDNRVLTDPRVQMQIKDGRILISGLFSKADVERIIQSIKSCWK